MLHRFKPQPRIIQFSLALLLVGLLTVLVTAPQALGTVIITATKTDALLDDADGNNVPSPGDTLSYTIIIQNTGDTDATNAVFNDTIDNNTTFVPNSLETSPLARNDSYSTVGNVQLTVPVGTGVLANDDDPDGSGGLSVTVTAGGTANGGTFAIAADGNFSYNPPPGFSGVDTFTYNLTDGEGNNNGAIVSITVGPVVWFINNTAGGPGDGRFTSPFNSIANFNTIAADDPGDYIFVYQGSGAYSGAMTLLNNQQLIGEGDGLTISPNLSIAAGTRPTIANVNLASGNTVSGLNISTNTGTGISGTSVGTLTISNVSVSNSGGPGVSLSNGVLSVAFDSVSSNGGTNGISLSGVTGSFASNGGTIQNSTSHGVLLNNTSGAMTAFSFTNSTVSASGGDGLRVSLAGNASLGKAEVASSTFTGNNIGVNLVTNDTANMGFDIHNNPTMSGTSTQVNISALDPTHNNSTGPTMEGYIRNNTITTSPTGSTFIGLWVVSDGDGDITVDINNNTITNFGESGIAVESRGGTGDVNARIANNSATTTATFPLDGMFLRAGNGTSGETNRLCVNLSGNNMNGGGSAVADYYLDRFNSPSTVFQLQGLSPSPATPTQTESFVASTDSAPPATAYVETGTYTAATCTTVSLAMAPVSGPMVAQAAEPATPEVVEPAAPQAEAAPTFITPGGYHGLASPLRAPITPVNLGTLNPGEQIEITFQVTINSGFSGSEVCNQGNVTADGGLNVLTDDPDFSGPTCTPVTAQTGSITVVKEANPADGTDFAFTSDIPGGASFSLDDEASQTDAISQTITFDGLATGSYAITETLPVDWELDSATCTGGSD
ncbi:MAG: cadherin-like domain-containing protein, partial [Anaerolineae bacterium]|nr:cadherin-like domain-containing protein [Anaerolineae bacterium]